MREKVLKQALELGPDGQEKDDGKYHGQLGYIDYRKGFRRAPREGAPCASPAVVRFLAPRVLLSFTNVAHALNLPAHDAPFPPPLGESTTSRPRRRRATTARSARQPTSGSPLSWTTSPTSARTTRRASFIRRRR